MTGDIRLGEWLVQPRLARASRHGQTVHLRAKVAELLVFLAEHPGEVVSKDTILEKVWGTGFISDSALTSVVTELRQTFGDDAASPWLLQTIPKQGYRLIALVETTGAAASGSVRGTVAPPTPRTGSGPHRHRVRDRVTRRVGFLESSGSGARRRRYPRDRSTRSCRLLVGVRTACRRHGASDADRLCAVTRRPNARVFRRGRSRVRPYAHALDSFGSRRLKGTEGAESPVFSRDGRWLTYWMSDEPSVTLNPADGNLMKVPLDGAPPTRMAKVRRPYGLSWMPDGSVVVGADSGGLLRVPGADQKPTPVTRPGDGEWSHRLPHVLPGGDAVLYTVVSGPARWHEAFIAVESLSTGKRTRLVAGVDARYLATGHLVFVNFGRLMVAPFDLKTLRLTGDPTTAEFDVMQALGAGHTTTDSGAAQMVVSDTGVLAYVPGGIAPPFTTTPMWVDRTGHATPVGLPPKEYFGARLSPTGKYVALDEGVLRWMVWIHDVRRGTLSPAVTAGASFPLWRRHGDRLIVADSGANSSGMSWVDVADNGSMRNLATSARGNLTPGDWTADGKMLVAARNDDIVVLSLQGASLVNERPLIATDAKESHPDLSPDGRWLAYVTTASGRPEVLVQSFPGLGERWQISTAGGSSPCWSPDGRELFYEEPGAGAKAMMRVQVSATNPPAFGVAERLFDSSQYAYTEPIRSFDISADGRKFLLIHRDDPRHAPLPARIHLVRDDVHERQLDEEDDW